MGSASATSTGATQSTGQNLQTFNGALGGAPPPVVTGGKGFVVDGSDFVNLGAALGRSCDVQHNACANAANVSSNHDFYSFLRRFLLMRMNSSQEEVSQWEIVILKTPSAEL